MKSTSRNDELPLPIVTYPPRRSGVFIGFKSGLQESTYLCKCSETAARNAIQFELEYLRETTKPATVDAIVEPQFPPEIVERVKERSVDAIDEILSVVEFQPGICHECNCVTPERMYSSHGSGFMARYGWYVKQKQLEYGIPQKTYELTVMSESLIDQLPDDVVDILDDEIVQNVAEKADRFRELDQKRRNREHRLKALIREREREIRDAQRAGDITGDEAWEWMNRIKERYDTETVLREEKEQELEQLRDELNTNLKRVRVAAENEVREAFGYEEKGSQWMHETILYHLIDDQYGDEYTLRRHHRPDWLEGLELDIFIEEADVGVEYQGEQHYNVVDHWGGEEALREQQDRDRRTRELCVEHGVELVEVRYDESLTEELVESRIGPHLNN